MICVHRCIISIMINIVTIITIIIVIIKIDVCNVSDDIRYHRCIARQRLEQRVCMV